MIEDSIAPIVRTIAPIVRTRTNSIVHVNNLKLNHSCKMLGYET